MDMRLPPSTEESELMQAAADSIVIIDQPDPPITSAHAAGCGDFCRDERILAWRQERAPRLPCDSA
jgi:hypothetical protein